MNFIDDHIETHISALDFESGYIANNFRTLFKEFLQYIVADHERIIGFEKINRRRQQKLIRKAARIDGARTQTRSFKSVTKIPRTPASVVQEAVFGYSIEDDKERFEGNYGAVFGSFFDMVESMHEYVTDNYRFTEDKFDFKKKHMIFYADNDIYKTEYEWSSNVEKHRKKLIKSL